MSHHTSHTHTYRQPGRGRGGGSASGLGRRRRSRKPEDSTGRHFLWIGGRRCGRPNTPLSPSPPHTQHTLTRTLFPPPMDSWHLGTHLNRVKEASSQKRTKLPNVVGRGSSSISSQLHHDSSSGSCYTFGAVDCCNLTGEKEEEVEEEGQQQVAPSQLRSGFG